MGASANAKPIDLKEEKLCRLLEDVSGKLAKKAKEKKGK